MAKINTILITREAGSFRKVEDWCAQNQVRLKALSFIEVESIPGLNIPKSDWIFFSSPKGARAYLKHYTIEAAKIASVGPGTAKFLIEKGYTIDFCGDVNDEPTVIGQKLNHTIPQNNTILFPIGNRSKRSVISQIDPSKMMEINSYRTIEKHQKITGYFDALLFTSPSNFSSFIATNPLHPAAIIIAMGKTTLDTILAFNANLQVITLKQPSEDGIIELIRRDF